MRRYLENRGAPIHGERADGTDVNAVGGSWGALISAGDYTVSFKPHGGNWVGDTLVHAHTDLAATVSDERIPVTGTVQWLGRAIEPYGEFQQTYYLVFEGESGTWEASKNYDGSWEAWVPAGHYDAMLRVFSHGLSGGGGYANVASVDIEAPTTLALDSAAARLTAEVTIATASETLEVGRVALWTDSANWDRPSIAGRAEIDAPLGTYELRASYGGSGVGQTQGTVLLDPAYVHAGDASLAHAVELFDVGGLLSVTGVELPSEASYADCPFLYAVETTTGLYSSVACPGSATLRVPAGTYAAQLDVSGLGTASPWATLHPCVSVTGG